MSEKPKVCPSCTWRGEVELTNGVCPQCSVNWESLHYQSELAALTQRLEAAEAERDALMTLKEAAISWRGWWVDEKDECEAKEEKCGCPVCELILAVDFIKGDA